MATDSTLQKIADNLLAQFDKTLLDNSTDFSSCDQILNAAPSEHKGGLESLYCDLLLDALISGYYRYSEMDTKQLVDDPLYTKFKKMVYGLDRSDPYNLLYYAIIDLVSGKKENVLQYLSAYLDEKIKSLNARIADYARRNKIPFVDYFTPLVAEDGKSLPARYSRDGVHPTEAGYEIMEATVLPVVRKIVK